MNEHEVQIDVKKKYNIPNNLSRKYFAEGILIISVDTANWILLHNVEEEKIFNLLIDFSIEDVLNKIGDSEQDMNNLVYVLTELEAKQFEFRKQKQSGLESLNLYLTNKCNLRCRHCYMFAGEPLEDELSSDEIFDLLKVFRCFGGCNLTLSGGEITERKDLKKIVSLSYELGLITTLLTNGTGWTDDLIEYVYDKIDEVQISIDGYDEKSNARIRGKGQFERTLNTVKKFYDKNTRVTVAITPIFPIDKDKYINFGKYLMNLFCNDNFNLNFSYELIPGREQSITDVDNEAYRSSIEEIVEAVYPNNKLEKFVLNHKSRILFSNCGYGGLSISADGGVYFCNRITELECYGNIRNKSFEEIYMLSQKISKMADVDNLSPCRACDLRYICGGGCRIAYVPSIIHSDENSQKIFIRESCSDEYKNDFYKKMIEANELFYW